MGNLFASHRTEQEVVLRQISNTGLYFGPFFTLAGYSDLVPFARLVEIDTSPGSILERLLDNLIADEANGSNNNQVGDVVKLKTVEGKLNIHEVVVTNDDEHIRCKISTTISSCVLLLSIDQSIVHEQMFEQPCTEFMVNIPAPNCADGKIKGELMLKHQDESITFEFILEPNTKNKPEIHIINKRYKIGNDEHLLQDVYGYIPPTSQQQPHPNAQVDALKENLVDCVVCLSDEKSTVVLPCRHMCLCNNCAQILRQQNGPKCPICRQQITSMLLIDYNDDVLVSVN